MSRPRRTFTREFKVQAVKLVTEQGYSYAEAARQLGVREHQIRTWKKLLDAELGGADSGGGIRPTLDAELHRLRAENKRLQLEHDILKRGGVLRAGVHMRDLFISRQPSFFPVRVMCRVLQVSAAGYCDWLHRQPSVTATRCDELAVAIRAIHADVKGRYGPPRMHAELVARQFPRSVSTVARLMKSLGRQAVSHRKFRVRTTDSKHEFPVAGNELDQDFTVNKPNEIWLSDTTDIPTREGWLYLAAVEDLYSRRVVGWSMGTTLESRLVVDALHLAVAQRFPSAGLLAHSDRGRQYASEHDQRMLSTHGITCGMSRAGNCDDNAPMESIFASLTQELVHHEDDPTIEAAKASVFEYIEVFCNRVRRHSSLEYVAPEEFESADSPELRARFSWGTPDQAAWALNDH